jgi:FtsP/CotA-like multicopper oxidase with cupredoxin domain
MRAHILVIALCCATAADASAQLPRLAINDNRTPAGTLRDGVLTLNLEITAGIWHPDADHSPGLIAIALGEVGKPATMPAPLIRVPRGTVVRTTLHNTLKESMLVWGLRSHSSSDSVRLQAGETRQFELTASDVGNYAYAAMRYRRIDVSPENPPGGNDLAAAGAFVVDETTKVGKDRILVIGSLLDTTQMSVQVGFLPRLVTLNGKSWPHTERLSYNLGDTIIWRVVNATPIPHPMHLHGFYFDILTRGTTAGDTIYSTDQIRKGVTERLGAYHTMTMRWVPNRAGNWLFHCHLTPHTVMHTAIGAMKASVEHPHVHDVVNGMSNLMIGTTVHGPEPRVPAAKRRLRLIVHEHDSIPGDRGPRFTYSWSESKPGKLVGPTIIVQQNEPTAITVVNRGKSQTGVHWHGIELESFDDGAVGYGGYGNRIAPVIAPNDSFIARMTPPRAGTFIYHTHVDEMRQQPGGLYGALVVVPEGKPFDAEREPVIVLGTPPDSAQGVLFNGERSPTFNLKVGQTYRLRMVHIMVGRPNMYVTLVDGQQPVEWQLVAKDGADLPAHQVRKGPARQSMANGETYDVLFTRAKAGELKFETRAANGTLFGWARVVVN